MYDEMMYESFEGMYESLFRESSHQRIRDARSGFRENDDERTMMESLFRKSSRQRIYDAISGFRENEKFDFFKERLLWAFGEGMAVYIVENARNKVPGVWHNVFFHSVAFCISLDCLVDKVQINFHEGGSLNIDFVREAERVFVAFVERYNEEKSLHGKSPFDSGEDEEFFVNKVGRWVGGHYNWRGKFGIPIPTSI